MSRTFFTTFLMLFSSFAHAHPGEHHGGFLRTIAHLLSEPDHLAMAFVAIVLGVAGARFFRRRASVRTQDTRR